MQIFENIKKNLKKYSRLFITGFTMGSADLVPGVSGGTIAFISGVYEELVYSIKYFSGKFFQVLLKEGIRNSITKAPFGFVIPLGIGIVAAILLLSEVLTYLLDVYPTYLWSLFFGLIVASIWIVRKRVVTWDPIDYFILFVGAIIAYFIVAAVPVSTPATPLAFLIAGMIAAMAMILPGISGSFLLVIMGKYDQILEAVVARDYLTLFLVAIGAVIGLAIFSRIITWLFARYHDIVIALLIGLMIGSLRKIWPWKEINGESISNVMPVVNMELIIALGIMFIGAFVVFRLDKLHVIKEQFEDVENKQFASKHKKALQKEEHD